MIDLCITLKNGKEFKFPCEKQEAVEIYNGTKYVMENGIEASIEIESDGIRTLINASSIDVLQCVPKKPKEIETLKNNVAKR